MILQLLDISVLIKHVIVSCDISFGQESGVVWQNTVKHVPLCQNVGKPNHPLCSFKIHTFFDELYGKVIVDCVGPLPRTKSGNQYILPIMCASTHFPEAIPIRRITTPIIVKALIKFFTLVGLPRSIQSDQGSNFTSRIFKQVMQQLGITNNKSSAYHPQSQGALERFHQTMKTMMRTYCYEHKNWDEGIPLLLFAIREVVQESLGFSPFELVFGHSVRGPLKLIKETWLNENNTNSILKYVSEFKNRLFKACELAKNNLKLSQQDMKNWYDKKTKQC